MDETFADSNEKPLLQLINGGRTPSASANHRCGNLTFSKDELNDLLIAQFQEYVDSILTKIFFNITDGGPFPDSQTISDAYCNLSKEFPPEQFPDFHFPPNFDLTPELIKRFMRLTVDLAKCQAYALSFSTALNGFLRESYRYGHDIFDLNILSRLDFSKDTPLGAYGLIQKLEGTVEKPIKILTGNLGYNCAQECSHLRLTAADVGGGFGSGCHDCKFYLHDVYLESGVPEWKWDSTKSSIRRSADGITSFQGSSNCTYHLKDIWFSNPDLKVKVDHCTFIVDNPNPLEGLLKVIPKGNRIILQEEWVDTVVRDYDGGK